MSLTVVLYKQHTCKHTPDNLCDNIDCHTEVVVFNVTHNLVPMAKEVEIYDYLWRQEENEINKANQLITFLNVSVALLELQPEKYKKYNPPNGWGSFETFLKFLKNLLSACEKYPNAIIRAYR